MRSILLWFSCSCPSFHNRRKLAWSSRSVSPMSTISASILLMPVGLSLAQSLANRDDGRWKNTFQLPPSDPEWSDRDRPATRTALTLEPTPTLKTKSLVAKLGLAKLGLAKICITQKKTRSRTPMLLSPSNYVNLQILRFYAVFFKKNASNVIETNCSSSLSKTSRYRFFFGDLFRITNSAVTCRQTDAH